MGLQSRELNGKIQRLSVTDNATNLFHLLGVYLFIAVGAAATLGFYRYQSLAQISFWWDVPVTLIAILWMGVAQHRLGGLAHDALHHLMFKNRILNELVSDWFCMFPIFSLTYFFRLEHLGHHQRVNDHERDPDVALLKESGYWLEGPLRKGQGWRGLLRLLNVPALIRYMTIRSQYASLFSVKHAFRRQDVKPVSIYLYNYSVVLHLIGTFALVTLLVWKGDPLLLHGLLGLVWLAFFEFYILLPEKIYEQSHFHPVISIRTLSIMRMTFITALFWGLGWLSYATQHWFILIYFLLWVVPMFTTFSLLTILQQGVQHANADRGRLTNSRVFLLNRFLEFSLFPFGLGYHQPHHLFPSVPHYRLKKLHETLSAYPEYRDNILVVRGYFFSPWRSSRRDPTVVAALGPEYAPRTCREAYIDNGVLAEDRVDGYGVREAGTERIKVAGETTPVPVPGGGDGSVETIHL